MKSLTAQEAVLIKADLLSQGLSLTTRLMNSYGRPYLVKRRAYGNPDPFEIRSADIPQELYLGADRVICSVNVRPGSTWLLDAEDGSFFVSRAGSSIRYSVDFPRHPKYYDYVAAGANNPSRMVTLYGGGSLGLFIYGDCDLVNTGNPCQYCSIEPNRKHVSEFANVISPAAAEEAILVSLQLDEGVIQQVMLNGGNFPELDKSFAYYVRMAEAARRALDRAKRDMPIHLIAFPPRDVKLIHALKGLGVEVAFNTEVFDDALFAKYCPGKELAGGHKLIWSALEEAVSVLGPRNAYSIFVGGLESVASLTEGLEYVAGLGATPVINVFHADPGTPLASHPVASTETIVGMGAALQEAYRRFSITRPFYDGCGRNSIDAEAAAGWFPAGQAIHSQ